MKLLRISGSQLVLPSGRSSFPVRILHPQHDERVRAGADDPRMFRDDVTHRHSKNGILQRTKRGLLANKIEFQINGDYLIVGLLVQKL